MPVAELRTAYGARPEGSASKLSTYRAGWRILKTMNNLYRIERPIAFFDAIRGMLALNAVILSVPLFITFFVTGLVPRLPSETLCTGLASIAGLTGLTGLTLTNVTRAS